MFSQGKISAKNQFFLPRRVSLTGNDLPAREGFPYEGRVYLPGEGFHALLGFTYKDRVFLPVNGSLSGEGFARIPYWGSALLRENIFAR